MRLAVFGAVSTALSLAVVVNAWLERGSFLPAAVHITRSGIALLVLLNFMVFVAIILGRVLSRLFFGNLRTLEVEHLYERSWFAVTETCLAMTMFRDELDLRFAVFFGTLLFVKIFHWIAQDRVDFMDQSGHPPSALAHLRMGLVMLALALVDAGMLAWSADYTLRRGPTMVLVFGFEYAILSFQITACAVKYVLHTIDLHGSEPWEDKSMYIFYLELFVDFAKLLSYSLLLSLTVPTRGLPLHTIRDLYLTLRSFLRRAGDLLRYRRATHGMDTRYPDATQEEVDRGGGVCVVCREDMVAADGAAAAPATSRKPKKLPCGHVFHFGCLKSWLERQQSCPTCRRSVLPETPRATPAAATPPAPNPQADPQQPQQPPVAPAGQLAGGGNNLGRGPPAPLIPGQPLAPQPAGGPIPPPGQVFPFPYFRPAFGAHPPHQAQHPNPDTTPSSSSSSTAGTVPTVPNLPEHQPAALPYHMPPAPFPFAWPHGPVLPHGVGTPSHPAAPPAARQTGTSPASGVREPTVPVLIPLFPPYWPTGAAPASHATPTATAQSSVAGGLSLATDQFEQLSDSALAELEGRTRERLLARLRDARRMEEELSTWMVRCGQLVSLMETVGETGSDTTG